MKRQEIVDVARSWKGVKWHHMGRNRNGIDCVGLLAMVANHFGIPYYGDEVNYRRTPENDKLVRTLVDQLILRRPPLKPGMAVVLRDSTQPCHVGIIGVRYGQLSLIHASVVQRQVYEEYWSTWESRFRMCLDYPGVED